MSPMSAIHIALLLIALMTLVACKDDEARRPLHVYAAASLTDAFQALKTGFQKRYPRARVSLVFAGSQTLQLQIQHGAVADVFASADHQHMKALQKAGLIHKVTTFACSSLTLIVPLQNPAKLRSFRDLPRAKRLVIGAQQVPVGAYTQTLLQRAAKAWGDGWRQQVLQRVASQEHSVRLVRAKVLLGEADAAIVYRTDAVGPKGLKRIPIPAAFNVKATYPIGIVKGSRRSALASRWLAYLRSPQGLRLLKRYGFEAP